MKPRKLILAATATAATILGTAGTASAHHPDITASVGCKNDSNLASVFLKATPWSTQEPARQVNAEVWFEQFNGSTWSQVSFPGSFNPGQGPIVREVIVEAGKSYRFRAINTKPWGPNGEYGSVGEWRDITVTVDPKPCAKPVPPTTVTVPPVTTVPVAPPTTVATPVDTIAPPVLTVEPPAVIGTAAVLERESLNGTLAYTGTGRGLLLVELGLGFSMVPFGAWLVRTSRKGGE